MSNAEINTLRRQNARLVATLKEHAIEDKDGRGRWYECKLCGEMAAINPERIPHKKKCVLHPLAP